MPSTPIAARPSVDEVHARLAPARERLRARDDEIVRLQVALAQIAAPTGDEGERGRRVAALLVDAGLRDVRADAAGNVLALRPGAAPDAAPVVVCAHLDTVFPHGTPLGVREDGARLVGPGIGDNARGLAVMLAVARELDGVRVRTRRPVLFAATTGEEGAGDLRGAKALFAGEAAGAHAAIIVDGAGDERVVHCALGSRRFRLTFRGPGGHSWAAYGVPNPVHAAGAAIARLAAVSLPHTPRTTMSVTRMGGGLSVNAIPEEAWLEVDLRATRAEPLERLTREIVAAAQRAAGDENERRATGTARLTLSVDPIGDRPCGELPAQHRLVQAAFEATRLVGRRPVSAVASTDANVPIGRGIPAVAIGGGGRGGAAHTAAEWYENAEGTLGVARALTLIAAAAGLAG
jgi:acetylornithine deacetylase/succinyl-diaminopimelate desuccinylase-like protein